jgi:ribosomal protein S18 acetylase RimI-like enzyme
MRIVQRAFAGETDIQAMIALARRFPGEHLHAIDLPYRFSSWALDDPDNAALWADADGQLLAWAVMQTPFWAIDITCHPDAVEDLHLRILAWTERRARDILHTPYGRPMWFVNVFADQAVCIRHLEAAGFAAQTDVGEDSWAKVWMLHGGDTIEQPALPPGFAIRPLAGEREVDAYVELQRAVFGSKNMTAEWRARTLRRPEYVPDLDLVIAAPDGRLAAFCICWLAEVPGLGVCGQVEPLGVHDDSRGLGLGRAILREGLRRLQAHGAERIYVETDRERNAALGLYEAVGFRVIRDVWVYRR